LVFSAIYGCRWKPIALSLTAAQSPRRLLSSTLPTVTIRNAHERPEVADKGTLIMSGLKPGNVLESIRVVKAQHAQCERAALPVDDYGLRTVLSYTGHVNRNVWRKQ
jgi:UDP-N-acetylglucosamine 2-epimerase